MRKTDTYFQGKNVIITGGSSGIGKATAKLLARTGANVFILARDLEKLDRALEEIRAEGNDQSQRYGAFSADVTKWEEVAAVIEDIVGAGGAPDILITSAGIVHPGHFEELPLSAFEDQMKVNFFGTLHSVKAVLPHLIRRGGGHIVLLSSMGGVFGVFGYTGYGASKFAVCGFAESLRAELRPHNIAVSLVLPADTQTPQLEQERRLRPLEVELITGTRKPEGLDHPSEFIAHWLAEVFFSDDGEPMNPEQVAESILRGIKRGQYLIFPSVMLRVAYRVRGFVVGLANWTQDKLTAVARRERRDQ